MLLKLKYATKEEIPEGYQDLYTEKNGEWVLTGVSGIKTDEDIERLQTALEKERNDHKETRAKLKGYKDLGELEEVQTRLDRVDELEHLAEGKVDETKLNELVEARVRSKVAPIQRQLEAKNQELEELDSKIKGYEAGNKRRTVHDKLRKAASQAKVRDTALDDILIIGENVFTTNEDGDVVTKDGVGVTPGVAPDVWLSEVQTSRPHWWPESQGLGARGNSGGPGGGANPWSAEGWNVTQQGKIMQENKEKAEQLAKAAGTTVNGKKPAPKK